MRVAIGQIRAEALNVAANVARTCVAIDAAAADGADLIVLPEVVTTGWVIDPQVRRLAEPADGSGFALGAWRKAAVDHDIAIIGGFVESANGGLYNSAVVIDRRGEIQGVFRKLHLFGSAEKAQFLPGDAGLPTFELDGVKIGVLVCYDLRFPEALRLLALSGAELIAVPTAWVRGFDQQVEGEAPRVGQLENVMVQANLNQVYVACADLVGKLRDIEFHRRSLIVDPYGNALTGPHSADDEVLAVVDIDPAECRKALDRGDGIHPRRDRRVDVYSLGASQAIETGNGAPPVDGAALLAAMTAERGYVLDIHRTLAERDPQFLVKYEAFLNATFLEQRLLDRHTKELIYVAVLTALQTDQAHLVAHMRAAIEHGSSEQELLEVIEQVLAPAGVTKFITGLKALEALGQNTPPPHAPVPAGEVD